MTSHLRVGRAPDSGLCLAHPYVSLEHAAIRWSGDGWEVKDLGSRNGTFVDGQRIPVGGAVSIDVGVEISFGDAEERWEVIEADPPGVIAQPEGGGAAVAGRDGLLVLPEPEHPALSIYRRSDGRWVAESVDGDVREVDDGALLAAGGRRWRLQLPAAFEGTPLVEVTPTLDSVSFRFKVSRDEETVQIDLHHRGRIIALEPMWHGYVLLTLARIREKARAVPVEERGWVERDRLLEMLRTDSNNLNVAIHKAREQLLEAGVLGAAGIVEVQRRRRRLGTDNFEVARLE